jgi:hypothetical protein
MPGMTSVSGVSIRVALIPLFPCGNALANTGADDKKEELKRNGSDCTLMRMRSETNPSFTLESSVTPNYGLDATIQLIENGFVSGLYAQPGLFEY